MILDFHLVSVPSGDIGMTRGPLFTRMFVTSTPRPVNEVIEYFVDSPGNIRRFPMTRAKAALLPALTRLIMFIFTVKIGCRRRLQYSDHNREFYILYFIKRYSTK